MSSKSTSSETFDEIHEVVLDGISDNMASLVESGKYVAINTSDASTNGFYVIIFVLIQNLVWVNVQFAVYHVHVLLVHQCCTNLGYPVYHQRNRNDINKLLSALIGQY